MDEKRASFAGFRPCSSSRISRKVGQFASFVRPNGAGMLAALSMALPLSGWAAPWISPFAAGLPSSSYSASANYGTWYLGSSAESAFNGGYWNAGSQGPDWIQADMGETKTLSMVKVKYASSYPYAASLPTGFPNFFINVYLSDNPIGNSWTTLTPVASILPPFTQSTYELNLASPASGRYLEVVVDYANLSWVALGDTGPVQTWVDPITTSPVPEPSSAALLAVGMLGLWARRRYRLFSGR